MPSYQHRNIIRHIERIDRMPETSARYSQWLTATDHLDLLRGNATEDELIVYACSRYTFIHGVLMNVDAVRQLAQENLLGWSGNPFSGRATYVWGGGRPDVWIDATSDFALSGPLREARQLVFAREFHGLKGDESVTYEILQEYSHISEIHWRPAESAYCRFDEHGDFDPIVSITSSQDADEVTLVSFKRAQLEEYLAASNSVLLRMFDFTLFQPGSFRVWSDRPEKTLTEGDDLIYRQKIDRGEAAYVRGVQVVRPSRSESEIFESIKNGWYSAGDSPGVEFIALDWRNKRITNISTDPSATTNYFQTEDNSLPFELSPAFFRPEVLHKYKADQDKYTVNEELRLITCRGAWDLRSFDINEEGQIHAYICDLRNLPYEEQMYWRGFNEKPKAWISDRAIQNDFKAEWSKITRPLEKVLYVLRRWSDSDVSWWTLREKALLERVSTPRTTSRDEWGREFKGLAKLVVEGFQVRAIRTRLQESDIEFEGEEKSLKLIERFLVGHNALADGGVLTGLRTVQTIRTKVDAHHGGSAGQDLANDALMEHESYTAHFESVCETVVQELEMIEKVFS